MKNRLAILGIVLSLALVTSCSSVGRWGSKHDLFDTGVALFNQGRFADAIPYLEDATRANPRDAQEEIINLLIDAGFAAAINDFRLGDILDSPRRSKETL